MATSAPKGKAPESKPKKKKDDDPGDARQDQAANYGWSIAFLKSHPALEKLFDEAVENTWSPQRFVAELQDTQWFKNHSDVVRQAVYLKATDPATYNNKVKALREQVANTAGALGVEVSGKTLDKWAEQAVMFGWDQSKVNNHLASQVDIMSKNSTVGGELASTLDRLKNLAMNNGVKLNDKTTQTWLREIVRGNSTQGEYEQYIKKMAIAAHPNWAKEINGGMTLADIADPYKQTMAQLLEVNPAEIGFDGVLAKALSYKDDKGQWQSRTMSEFEDELRKDPRWMKTDNAKEQFMTTGNNVLKMFGLVG